MSQYSPLHSFHVAAGAKLADFGGWQMPIEYPAKDGGGVLSEHLAVRNTVGLFDVSHLGKARVSGPGALDFLNTIFTNDLSKISDGQAQYTLICDENSGGVIDDLIAYRHSANEVFLIPNAANTEAVIAQLRSKAPSGVLIENLHNKFSVLALQGPKSIEVLKSLGIQESLEYMSFTTALIDGMKVVLCRTGYTGEIGFEILTNWDESLAVWNKILPIVKAQGGAIAGLGARDTLRTEMGYPLHGHELSLEISPVEASAGWAVAWHKSFSGKEILQRQRENKQHRKLHAVMLLERGIPRAGMKILDEAGVEIGVVTSGTFSPSLKVGIALALLNIKLGAETVVQIDIRGNATKAKIARLPFVPSRVR